MADGELVLNDALCFLSNKFGKVTLKTLKSAVMDFYVLESLANAKIRLLDDVRDMHLSTKHPHIPRRRDGDGRLQHEVDDLLSLFTFLDEQKVMDRLPRYVSGSPDNMPSLRLYEGDLQVLMTMIRSMNENMEEFRSALAVIASDVKEVQAWPCLPEPALSTHARPVSAACAINYNRSADLLSAAASREITHTPTESETNKVTGGDDEDAASAYTGVNWALATAAAASTPRPLAQGGRKRDRNDRPQSSQQTGGALRLTNSQRPRTMYGTGTNSGARISAAKKLPNKAVFCIDNIDLKYSVDDMIRFVRNLRVDVISCFEVKPRRRYNEGAVTDRRAFRLCITDSSRERLLNPASWPEYVTISDWYFKPQVNAASVGAGSTPDAVVKRVKVGNEQVEVVASVSDSNHVSIGDEAGVARAEILHAGASYDTAVDTCNDDTILEAACAMDIQHDGE